MVGAAVKPPDESSHRLKTAATGPPPCERTSVVDSWSLSSETDCSSLILCTCSASSDTQLDAGASTPAG